MDEIKPFSQPSADLYEFIHSETDAARDATKLHDLLVSVAPNAQTLLDVACGTGWHLATLRIWYLVEGVDSSPAMLRHARSRLHGVPLHEADMRSFDLGKAFDVVICLSSSIAHMRSREDLQAAIHAMARHTRPGGVLVIEPWDLPESEADETPWIHSVRRDDRAVTLLETTTLGESTWQQETHYLVWERGSATEHLVERSTLGAFSKADHVQALENAGFEVRFDDVGLLGRGLFIAARTR